MPKQNRQGNTLILVARLARRVCSDLPITFKATPRHSKDCHRHTNFEEHHMSSCFLIVQS